jgi:two-component system cell cycle sensor histidine kinase/response regulator CckA
MIFTADASTFLFPLIQTWPTASPSAETLLVERRGDQALFLNDLRRQQNTALRLGFPLTQTGTSAVMAVLGTSGIVEGHDYAGVKVVAAIQRVPDSPWFIVAKIDASEAFGGLFSQSALIAAFDILLLAALVGAVLLTWQRGLKRHYYDAYQSEVSRQALLARYEHLIQQANDIIIVGDEDMRIVEVNESAVRALGYTREELLGLRLPDLIPPEGMAGFEQNIQALKETGSFLAEGSQRRKDGSVFPVEISARVVLTDGKRYLQGIIRDLGERKRTETMLQLTRFSIDHAVDSVLWTDMKGSILFVSDSTCLMHGYSRDELLTMSIFDLTPSFSRETWLENHAKLRGQGSRRNEGFHRTKTGELFPVEVNINYIEFDGQEYSCAFVRDISERRKAETALKELASRQQAILDAVPDIIMEVDNSRVYTWANEAGLEFFGDDVVGKEAAFYFESEQDTYETIQPLFDGARDLAYVESWQRRKDGEMRLLAWTCRGLRDDDGSVVGVLSSALDITERRRVEDSLRASEERLRQSQKMEAIGQLAGGIAHDFNNLLTAIIGYSDLLLARQELEGSMAHEDAEEIRNAAARAAALTGQILAFSRRQTLRPKVVSLNAVLAEIEPLLRRTLGEDIDFVSHHDPGLAYVEVDVHQFGQVLMNLALNARDAMASGGRLTLETANVEFDEEYCQLHPWATPGTYVMLSVSDTGVGMDDATLARIFEPFFTTKDPGKGTGLGLSTVYGIVNQSGGSISVDSKPGSGTTFRIYLPRSEAHTAPAETVRAKHVPKKGDESVMVVEDEPALRSLIERVLRHAGYDVVTLASADEAALALQTGYDDLDLLLTDVVLPGVMQGKDLFDEVQVSRPGLPVLFMSGYTRETIVRAGRLGEGFNLLEKPFTPEVLASTVRQVLDEAQSSG